MPLQHTQLLWIPRPPPLLPDVSPLHTRARAQPAAAFALMSAWVAGADLPRYVPDDSDAPAPPWTGSLAPDLVA
jgi:hypothetical protein